MLAERAHVSLVFGTPVVAGLAELAWFTGVQSVAVGVCMLRRMLAVALGVELCSRVWPQVLNLLLAPPCSWSSRLLRRRLCWLARQCHGPLVPARRPRWRRQQMAAARSGGACSACRARPAWALDERD